MCRELEKKKEASVGWQYIGEFMVDGCQDGLNMGG